MSGFFSSLERDGLRLQRRWSRTSPALVGTDPYRYYVTSHVRCDDPANPFYDPFNIWTINGTASITTPPDLSGGYSGAFLAPGNYISLSSNSHFGFGAESYTVEGRNYYASTTAANQCIFDNRTLSDEGIGIYVTDGSLNGYLQVFNNAALIATSSPVGFSPNTNQAWMVSRHMVAGVGTVYISINGVILATGTDSRTYSSSPPCVIGANYIGGQTAYASGAEYRITKGVCRHTADYIPEATFPGTSGLLDSLVSYFDMDTTAFVDSHGPNSLTAVGTMTATAGLVGNASTSAGSGDRLRKTSPLDVDFISGPFTVGGWVNTSTSNFGVLSRWQSDTGNKQWALLLESGIARFVVSSDGSAGIDASTGSGLASGTQHFLIGWRSVADGKTYIQVDDGTPVSAVFTGTIFNGTSALTLHALKDDSTYSGAGQEDELFIYARELSSDERSALFNDARGRHYSTLGTPYYGSSRLRFEGPDASTGFTDDNGRVWTATGGAQIDKAQFYTGASSGLFNGSTSYITTPDTADLRPGTGDFHFKFSAKFNSLPSYQTMVNKGYVSSGGFVIQTGAANELLNFYMNGSLICAETVPPAVALAWAKFDIKRVGTTVTITRDNVVTATGTSSANLNSTADLGIGAGSSGSPAGNHVDGWIDDWEIV